MSDPSSVTYTTAEILKRIEDKIDNNQKEIKQEIKEVNQKLDKINERLTHLEIGQGSLTEKVEGMDKRLQNVEGTQKNQIWALIVIVASAIITGGAKLFYH
ncbi:hemolysin XhlA family protein [Crocosphaera chwakensis]|uniref:Uncharacterized protein n=1 Tax=Crocosphaera chwakensis CCY0110 TaxID=391612 RepID=A3IKC6_9CHRO|nr:hypothetical protein [Crocosphaera chwakensis]EAZ93115.1 hypothetical protein CY0110_03564 [Crocosphaera chwakensis CCY0110]